MTVNIQLTLIGMFLDIAGAWFLAKGLVKKTVTQMEKETGFSWDTNKYYIAGCIKQKYESIIGFTLLCFGFATQTGSYIIRDITIENLALIICGFYIVLFIVVILWCNRKVSKQIKNLAKEKVIEHINKYGDIDKYGDAPMNISDIKYYLDVLGKRNDSTEDKIELWNTLKKYTLQ